MLTITPQASEAIRGILASENIPEGSVIRISPPAQTDSQQEAGLVVSITDSPPPNDEVVEGDAVEICVEPNVAQILDDKELDATVVDDEVNFTIGQQAA